MKRSTKLTEWASWAPLLLTNGSPHGRSLNDTQAAVLPQDFYRALTNLQITAYPKPTGLFPVGTVARLVTDPSRTNRYAPTNSSFMIQVWYPSRREAGVLRSLMDDPEVIHDMPPILLGTQVPQRLKDFASGMVGHAIEGAEAMTKDLPRPVALYSPGCTFTRRQPGPQAEELASWGYVVVSIDHADCFGTVFPDGRHFTPGLTIPDLMRNQRPYVQDRLLDMQFVLDELSQLNTVDPVLAGCFDLGNVAAMGYSWGGGVAGEICRTNTSVKALVMFDAYLQCVDTLRNLGLNKPLMGFYADASGETTLYDKAATNAYWMSMKGSVHLHFANEQAMLLVPSARLREMSQTINACTRSFLDKYLRGMDDQLLDHPTNIFPRSIAGYMKK